MNQKMRFTGCLIVVALALPTGAVAQDATGASASSQPLHEASIAALQRRMDDGQLSAQALTQLFLGRIAALDRAGPTVNSVIELNPDALAIARRLDAQRKTASTHGTMLGIPVLLKDNIDTGDKMLTTAGSLAMTGAPAPRD